ncbi:unnamed protein product [Mytilus edulis]|uniref:C2H2-type domain-containing protein n=1 Tax=Mytilus edulis TaxID=6550 RepID=A0A8S3UQ86_MYTED|nr:unnamed protein product [Mytilus edulis]
MENCACCGEHFNKRPDRKRYERTNIHTNYKTFGSVANAIEGLYGVSVTPSKDVYICNNCTCLITTANKKAEKIRETESRLRKSVTVNNTKIGHAVSNIGRGKYSKGFRELWKQSKTAKRAAIHVLQDEIRNEVTQFAKTTPGETSLDDILGFNWNLILHKAAIVCPSLTDLLTSALTRHRQVNKTKKKGSKIISVAPVLGALLCMIGFHRSVRSSLFQQLNSVKMWLGGSKRKVIMVT